MTRNRLYLFLASACTIGFIWVAFTFQRKISNESELGVCLFKRLTNVPCPACGSTRSVVSLLNGDFWGAAQWNPFGFIITGALIITPVWILYDLIRKKATLFLFYTSSENFFRQKRVAVFAVLIVLINWIWNIYKGY